MDKIQNVIQLLFHQQLVYIKLNFKFHHLLFYFMARFHNK